jgi:hypothetical protein
MRQKKDAAINCDCGVLSFAARLGVRLLATFPNYVPDYNDRRKFTRSCWFFGLRLLKLVMT